MGDERELSHLNEAGEVHMVDVGGKQVTDREAVAEGFVVMSPDLAERFFTGDLPKGDAAGGGPDRRDHGCQTDLRAHPALSSDLADRGGGHPGAEWAWCSGPC